MNSNALCSNVKLQEYSSTKSVVSFQKLRDFGTCSKFWKFSDVLGKLSDHLPEILSTFMSQVICWKRSVVHVPSCAYTEILINIRKDTVTMHSTRPAH